MLAADYLSFVIDSSASHSQFVPATSCHLWWGSPSSLSPWAPPLWISLWSPQGASPHPGLAFEPTDKPSAPAPRTCDKLGTGPSVWGEPRDISQHHPESLQVSGYPCMGWVHSTGREEPCSVGKKCQHQPEQSKGSQAWQSRASGQRCVPSRVPQPPSIGVPSICEKM